LGRNGVLKLAQQMTAGFCATICGASPRGQPWSRVQEWRGSSGDVGADRFEVAVRVATLHTAGYGQGAQAGLVVSAATVVWLPGVPAKHVFDYICDGDRRAEWDTFLKGAPVQQEDYAIALKTPRVYAVSVLHPKVTESLAS
jgi:homeobox-leucine zipper protein